MAQFLFVPIKLDALCLEHETSVLSEYRVFDKLPHMDNAEGDINLNTPNLSIGVENQAFNDRNLNLPAGVHLHWALPAGLTHGVHRPGSDTIEFRAAPNRWLVVRNSGGPDEKKWVVESDFVSLTQDSEVIKNGGASVTYPVPAVPHPRALGRVQKPLTDPKARKAAANARMVPFRYLGRVQEAAPEWKQDPDKTKYLADIGPDYKLTAVGYGEPAFAAFYPNCRGVFGMHDDLQLRQVTRYDLFGWYSDINDDPFKIFINEFTGIPDMQLRGLLNRYAKERDGKLLAEDTRLDETHYADAFRFLLRERFEWNVSTNEIPPIPAGFSLDRTGAMARLKNFDGIICFSRLTIKSGHDVLPLPDAKNTMVAIGNTGSEALATLLANNLNSQNADQAEEQLEALSLLRELSHHQLDIGPKFREARHAKGFRPVSGESVWIIRPGQQDNQLPGSADSADQGQITLPVALAHELNLLNQWQQAYDRTSFEIEDMGHELFSNWHKFMEASYHDGSEFFAQFNNDYLSEDARRYIHEKNLAPLQAKLAERGEITFEKNQIDNSWKAEVTLPSEFIRPEPSLADQLKKQFDIFLKGFTDFNQALRPIVPLILEQTSGPRFYSPNEPVVLIGGNDPSLRPASRYDEEELNCHVPSLAKFDRALINNESHTNLIKSVDRLKSSFPDQLNSAMKDQSERPWNPFLLEWEALVETPGEGGDRLREYHDNFIENAGLAESLLGLDKVPDSGGLYSADFHPIRGRTVLSSHPSEHLVAQIREYLYEHPLWTVLVDLGKQIKEPNPPELKTLSDVLKTAEKVRAAITPNASSELRLFLPKLKTALDSIATSADSVKALINQAKVAIKNLQDNAPTILGALDKVLGDDFHFLAQSLGGFNRALLMRRQSFQLPIFDPIAESDPEDFPDIRNFNTQVRKALLGAANMLDSPESAYGFYPIRVGRLKILRLRLVDTFGQALNCPHGSLICSLGFGGEVTDHAGLAPRLTQPARLSFRWRSASDNDVEATEHPAATPVCGWLVPNHLDQSLVIYSSEGAMLGTVEQSGRWRMPPGTNSGPVRVEDISNPHLRKLVLWLAANLAAEKDPKIGFMSNLDTALDKIDPENFAQHRARALLLGRPLALARASVNLELRGLPANDKSWEDFRSRLSGKELNQRAFTKVKFPIRIGDHSQFNDGVAAYWEEKDGDLKTVTLPATDSGSSAIIWQSIADEPTTLSMLIDPRASVHAFCGVLPTKAITIPTDQYADVLKGLQVTFLTAPLLTEPGKTFLPLPNEPGFSWAWLQRDGPAWTTVPAAPVLEREVILKAFPSNGSQIWDQLILEPWIQLNGSADRGRVLPQLPLMDDKKRFRLSGFTDEQVENIKRVIDQSARSINPVQLDAHFGPRAEIREGWLQLSQEFEP